MDIFNLIIREACVHRAFRFQFAHADMKAATPSCKSLNLVVFPFAFAIISVNPCNVCHLHVIDR